MPLPGSEWVQPWWLHRQRDSDSAAYHPSGGVPINAVGRSWTLTGTLDSPVRIPVDRRGLVVARPGRWALDWWVRAGEDWIFPSQTAGVRQRLVDGAPVIETVLRVAGGEIVHRVSGSRLGGEFLLVEVENAASAPIALALAVRPYDHQGAGRVLSVSLDDHLVSVDGEPGLICGRAPGGLVVGSGGDDAASHLDAGATADEVSCELGRATAALVFPLVHGSTLRVAVPLDAEAGTAGDDVVARLPGGDRVARGWGQHAVNACRVVLPAGRLAEAFDAARQGVLLAATGDDVVPAPFGPPPAPGDDLDVLLTLAEAGYTSTVRELLLARARRQDALGAVFDADADVTATTLLAARRLYELHPDPAFEQALGEMVADASRWLLEHRDQPLAGPGLAAAEAILTHLDAGDAARELAAVRPQIRPRATEEVLDDGLLEEREGPRGHQIALSGRLALAELRSAPQRGFTRLEAVVAAASPAWSWPSYTHPRLGTGTGGAGHDLGVTATVTRAIVRLLVDDGADEARPGPIGFPHGDETPPELVVLRCLPAAWIGTGLEVHGVPSAYGSVSWALRWHGERPALLWEVTGGPETLVVSAPGVDPSWRGRGPKGEALLAAVEPPAAAESPTVAPEADTGTEPGPKSFS